MYRLIRFGTTNLEYLNQIDSIGSGQTPVNFMILPEGGALDGYGGRQKSPGTVERSKTVRLWASTESALESIFLDILSQRGKRDRLLRRTSQGDYHWMYARLVEVQGGRSFEQTKFRRVQDVGLMFVGQEANWKGFYRTEWELDDGIYLDSCYRLDSSEVHALTSSPTTFTITVGSASDKGRMPVRGVKMIVAAGDAGMSAITIARSGGESLLYDDTVPSGGTLTIDTGLMTVSCTGESNAYDNLTFTATADMAAWFTLQPGSNDISVSFTGGGTGRQIDFEFCEAWA